MVAVALLIGALYVAVLIQPIMQVLVMAFIVTLLVFTPARAITRRSRVPYPLAVIWFYVLFILLIFFLIVIFLPALIRWIDGIIERLEVAYAELAARLADYEPEQGVVEFLGFEMDLNFIIEPTRVFILSFASRQELAAPDAPQDPMDTSSIWEELAEEIEGDSTESLQVDLFSLVTGLSGVVGSLTGTLTSAVTALAALVLEMLLVLFLSFLILLELPHAYNIFFKVVPEAYHREYSLLIDKIISVWNGFFRGQVIIGFLIGLFTWIQLTVMGIASAEFIAIFTGIISLIPTIGGLIALIPIGLVPLLQGSSVLAIPPGTLVLLVVVINLVFQAVMWNVVAPKILGDAVAIPLPIILVGLFMGTILGGIWGAFVVAPVLGTARVILEYIINKLSRKDPYPGEPEPLLLAWGLFAPPEALPASTDSD